MHQLVDCTEYFKFFSTFNDFVYSDGLSNATKKCVIHIGPCFSQTSHNPKRDPHLTKKNALSEPLLCFHIWWMTRSNNLYSTFLFYHFVLIFVVSPIFPLFALHFVPGNNASESSVSPVSSVWSVILNNTQERVRGCVTMNKRAVLGTAGKN